MALPANFFKGIVFVLLLGYSGIYVLLSSLPDGLFHVYFFDVGQGDSIFVQTPENHQILVDGGKGDLVLEGLGEVMPFFDRSLDLVVLTHPHEDHVAGLVEVVQRYEVAAVLLTGVESTNLSYKEFLGELEQQDVPVVVADSESDFVFGAVKMDVLYPFESLEGAEIKNLNNSSIATKFVFGEHEVLLTGDLEEEIEKELLEAGVDLEADILKAGHHGSKSSSTVEFLEAVDPDVVVVSAGKGNRYGHPHPEVLRNFYQAGVEKVLRTDEEGMIEFVFR